MNFLIIPIIIGLVGYFVGTQVKYNKVIRWSYLIVLAFLIMWVFAAGGSCGGAALFCFGPLIPMFFILVWVGFGIGLFVGYLKAKKLAKSNQTVNLR